MNKIKINIHKNNKINKKMKDGEGSTPQPHRTKPFKPFKPKKAFEPESEQRGKDSATTNLKGEKYTKLEKPKQISMNNENTISESNRSNTEVINPPKLPLSLANPHLLQIPNINRKTIASLMRFRTLSFFSLSLITYFTLSLSLFLIGLKSYNSINLNFSEKKFIKLIVLCCGVCEYIIGFFDWYRGSTPEFLVEFFFGLIFINYFSVYYIRDFTGNFPQKYSNENLLDDYGFFDSNWEACEGTFYLLFCVLLITLMLTINKKGIIHSIDFLLLTITCIFLLVYRYNKSFDSWLRKAFSVCAMISGAAWWITGILKFIQDCLKTNRMNFV